jgi:HEAT repeat protein
MGILDFLKGRGGESADKTKTQIARLAERANDKRAQPYDRQEAIHALVAMKSLEAAEPLLRRFTFSCEPSITDREEKDLVFGAIVAVGASILPALRAQVKKADTVGWPLRVARGVLDDDAYVTEVLEWLAPWDTEYAKFIDPKLQILAALAEVRHEAIAPAVERFLEDVNEEARFNTVGALFAQEAEGVSAALLSTLAGDESVRVRTRIAEELLARQWPVPAEEHDRVRKGLPGGYSIDAAGLMSKRAVVDLPWL